ncbi:MAG: alkaline phosphatase family protein [Gemmatimonadaceae bacterium]
MNRALTSAVTLLLIAACAPSAVPPPSPESRPRLVVWITVDQLRGDMVDHYAPMWTGGFRRLLDESRFYTNATHDHGRTVTAAGHANLSTGTHPSRHGIVGNAWDERAGNEWVSVSNVGDSTVKTIGSDLPGVSPRPLMRTGLADWMVAADSASQVASVSGKDRGAILPAAHVKGQVYWFEPGGGGFVTSTYYRERYPEWVDRFNRESLAPYMADTVWTFQAPTSSIFLSSPDTGAHEGDGTHTYFPHRLADHTENRDTATLLAWMEWTPLADAATIDFAETMVRELSLGSDASVDLLAISVSQTDAVGHGFGPFSREQLDNLYRLDRRLGAFFTFLDDTVGRDRWILGLSADHGVMTPPEDPRAVAGSRRLTPEELQQANKVITDAVAAGGNVAERIATELERLPIIADAWPEAHLLRRTPSDSFAVLARRSMYPGRAGGIASRQGVEVHLVPFVLGGERGTTHGSPYWYDRHVPIMFMGAGIAGGRDETRVSTTDFAPTLARFLGIPYPRDVDGRALTLGSSP